MKFKALCDMHAELEDDDMDQDDSQAAAGDGPQTQLDDVQMQFRRRARLSHWLQVRITARLLTRLACASPCYASHCLAEAVLQRPFALPCISPSHLLTHVQALICGAKGVDAAVCALQWT